MFLEFAQSSWRWQIVQAERSPRSIKPPGSNFNSASGSLAAGISLFTYFSVEVNTSARAGVQTCRRTVHLSNFHYLISLQWTLRAKFSGGHINPLTRASQVKPPDSSSSSEPPEGSRADRTRSDKPVPDDSILDDRERNPRQSSSDSSIIGGIPLEEMPTDSLLRTVTKHAARYDYEQAIYILQSIPPEKRGHVLEDRLRDLQERVTLIQQLHEEIETAQKDDQEQTVVSATRRLMQVKPNDPLIRQILQTYGSLDDQGKYQLPAPSQPAAVVGEDPPRMIVWAIVTGIVAFLGAYSFIDWMLKAPRQALQVRVPAAMADDDLRLEIDGRSFQPGDGRNVTELDPGEYEYHATRNGETVKRGLLVVDKEPTAPLELDLETEPWALRFDGVRSYLAIPRLSFDLSNPFTFECWCTPADNDPGMILDTEGDFGFAVGINAEGNWEVRYPTSVGYEAETVGLCEPGIRVHLACVADRERILVYINGEVLGTAETGPRQATTMEGYLIGTDHPQDGPFYEGTLEGVRLSSTSRYPSSFEPEADLEADEATLLLFRNTEHRRDLIVDHSGNSHHARQSGTEWEPTRADANL